jgi:hypothetical protein
MTGQDWTQYSGTDTRPDGTRDATGVIYRHSQCPIALIRDGTSNTYLLGERFVSTDDYHTGNCWGDDQGWDLGYDFDSIRWTTRPPLRDKEDCGLDQPFGSAHASAFQMAMCDGSVDRRSYSIDAAVHRQLGNREDGRPLGGAR